LGNLASVVVTSELHRSFVDFYENAIECPALWAEEAVE
jgi:hypothetical protein